MPGLLHLRTRSGTSSGPNQCDTPGALLLLTVHPSVPNIHINICEPIYPDLKIIMSAGKYKCVNNIIFTLMPLSRSSVGQKVRVGSFLCLSIGNLGYKKL